MSQETIQPFNVIGIAVRTTNENGQSGKDIPALWNRFITEGIIHQIPNKIDTALYCIYTEYEKDHTKPYTTILGCKVSSLEDIPAGMKGTSFEEGPYEKITAKGNIQEGLVFNEWLKIWESAMPRAFTADYEVYGTKASDPENAEVDIFIAIQ
jgi:predicted transcriptional regulator YdeE